MNNFARLLAVGLLAAPPASAEAGDPARGATLYRACVACHALEPGLHLTGPSLGGVWMRPAGRAEGFLRYSDGLDRAGFLWDAATLDAWLADPQAMIPGTSMTFAGIVDAGDRADLVAFLEQAGAAGGAERLVADTPEILESYGAAHELDTYNWVFLTARPGQPEDATRRLAEAYGLKFEPVEGGQQMHAVVTHVIDRGGRFAAKFHGLRFDPVNLVLYVNGLTNASQRPMPRSRLWDGVRAMFERRP